VTWRLARRVGGPVAGLAALVLLALCPTFYGHMFMNPKDAPFAVAMAVLMLGLVRLAQEYPAPSPHTVLIIGLGAGLSVGSRILGGLAMVYAAIGFLPIWMSEYRVHGPREALRRLGHVAYVLLPGLLLGYLVMGLIWPWSIIDPANPFRALTYFSHFFEKPWKELFDGAIVSVRTCRGRICRRCSRSSFRKCCSPCSAPVSSQHSRRWSVPRSIPGARPSC